VDVTILGGGPVGLFAAFYAGMRGMSVRILDSLPELGGQLTALYPEKYVYDMPGFPKVLAKDLARDLIEQGLQFGPEVVLEQTANQLVKTEEGWDILTLAGETYPTRTLIIAAGAGAFTPTKLGVPSEEEFVGRGLYYGVKSKEEFRGKRVAVVGGGDSAFDWALNLHGIADSLCIIHRRDQFKAHETSVDQVRQLGIELRLWQVVKGLSGTTCLEALEIENTQTKELETAPFDCVIVNIGFKSSLGPLLGWGLNIVKNQIQVDHLYQTNLPGVFAVGDVATFDGKLKLIATGVGEAATAVCVAKTIIDPASKLFPGHSSDMDLTGSPTG